MKTTRKIFLALVLTLVVAAVLSVCAFAALNFETDMPAGVQKGETGWVDSGYADIDAENSGWTLIGVPSGFDKVANGAFPKLTAFEKAYFYWNKTAKKGVWIPTQNNMSSNSGMATVIDPRNPDVTTDGGKKLYTIACVFIDIAEEKKAAFSNIYVGGYIYQNNAYTTLKDTRPLWARYHAKGYATAGNWDSISCTSDQYTLYTNKKTELSATLSGEALEDALVEYVLVNITGISTARNCLLDGVQYNTGWIFKQLEDNGYVFESLEIRAGNTSAPVLGTVGYVLSMIETKTVLFDSKITGINIGATWRGLFRSVANLKTVAHVTYDADKSGKYTGTVTENVVDLSGFATVTPYSSGANIADRAFYYASGIENVVYFTTLKSGETENAGWVDAGMFEGATSLKTFTMNAPLTKLSATAFGACTKLATLDLKGGVASGVSIATNAFNKSATIEALVYDETSKTNLETALTAAGYTNITVTLVDAGGEEPDEPDEPEEPATMPVGVDKTSDKWTNSGYTDVDTEDGWYLMSGNEDYSTTTTSFPTFAALAGGRFYWNKTTGEAVWLVTSSNMSGNSGEENPVSLNDPTAQANTQMRFYAYASCFVDITNKTGNAIKTHFAGGTSEKSQYVTQNATNYPIYERYITAKKASKQWSNVIVTAQAYADFVAYKATLGYAEDAAVEDAAHQDLLVEWAFANIAPYKQLRNCLEDGAKFNMAWVFAQLEKEGYIFTKVEFRAAKGVTPYYGTVGLVAKCIEAETILMDSKINDLRFTNTDRGLFVGNSSLRTFAHVTYNTDMSGEYTGTVKTGVVNLSGFAKVTTYTVSNIVRAFSDLLEQAGMTEVVWFNSVKSGDTEYAGHIDTDALKAAKNLTKVTLTAPLTAIAANAFNGATALKTIDLKGGVASDVTVASTAFSGATQSIEAIVYSNAAKTALESALSTAGIKNVTITLVTTTPDAANNAIRADGYSIRLNDDNAKTPGPALRAEFTLLNSNIAAAKAEGFDLSSYGVIVFSANTLNGTTYNGDIDAVLEAAKAGTDTRIIVKSAVNGPYVNGAALETNPDLDKVFAAAVTGIPEGNFTSAVYTYAYAAWTDGTDTYYTYTTYTSDRTSKTAHSLYDATVFAFMSGIANSQNTDADKLWPVLDKGAFSITDGEQKGFANGLSLNVAYNFTDEDGNANTANTFTYSNLPLRAWIFGNLSSTGAVQWNSAANRLEETSSTNVVWSLLTDTMADGTVELVVAYRRAPGAAEDAVATIPRIKDRGSSGGFAPYSSSYFTPGTTYTAVDSTTGNGLYKQATIYSPILTEANENKIKTLVVDYGVDVFAPSALENTTVGTLATIVYPEGMTASTYVLTYNYYVTNMVYASKNKTSLTADTQVEGFGNIIDLSGLASVSIHYAFSSTSLAENIILPENVVGTNGIQEAFYNAKKLKRVWAVGADVPAANTIDLTAANKLVSFCKNAFTNVPASTIIMPESFQGVAEYSMLLKEADACARVFGTDKAHTIVLGENSEALTRAYASGKNGGLIAYYDKLHTIATTDTDYNNVDLINVTCTVDEGTFTKTIAEWKTYFEEKAAEEAAIAAEAYDVRREKGASVKRL